MSTASTRLFRSVALNSAMSRTITTRHLRFGNAPRTNARARSLGAYANIVGGSATSTNASLDTRFDQLEVGFPFDKLPNDRIFRVLDLFDCSYLANGALVQHRDA